MRFKVKKKPKNLRKDKEFFEEEIEIDLTGDYNAYENLVNSTNITIYQADLKPDPGCDDEVLWIKAKNIEGFKELERVFGKLVYIGDIEDYVGKITYAIPDLTYCYLFSPAKAAAFINRIEELCDALNQM